jgi:hypothetical protein
MGFIQPPEHTTSGPLPLPPDFSMILKTGELAAAILENKGVNGYDPENIWVISLLLTAFL